MLRRPPGATRTAPVFPYTTLVRSVVHGEVGRRGIVHEDEGQLENFGAREDARGIAVDGPDDVDHTVAHLLDQLLRPPAQRHRRIDLDLHPASSVLLDLPGPGLQHLGLRRRLGTEKMVQRSEEHTSELQSLMRNSYAVFCLTKKKQH